MRDAYRNLPGLDRKCLMSHPNIHMRLSLEFKPKLCYRRQYMSREQEENSHPPPTHPHFLTRASYTKEMRQLKTLWRRLPAEQQVTLGLHFVETILKGNYRQYFLHVNAKKHLLKTTELESAYPTIEISEADLRQANLDHREIAQLEIEDRRTMAETIRNHYIYDLFWPELRHLAQLLLDDHPKKSEQNP